MTPDGTSMSQLAGEDCTWCGEGPWQLQCRTCDPRTTKRLCSACARRWHSRGFSREHVLTDRRGTAQSYAKWIARDESRPQPIAPTADVVIGASSSPATTAVCASAVEAMPSTAPGIVGTDKQLASVPATENGSAHGGRDGTASRDATTESTSLGASVAAAPTIIPSEQTTLATAESQDTARTDTQDSQTAGDMPMDADEEATQTQHWEGAEALAVRHESGATVDDSASAAAPPLRTTAPQRAQSKPSSPSSVESGEIVEDSNETVGDEIAEEIPEPQSEATQLDLEEVLERFPTDEAPILEALADHIASAIRVEDALLCHRYIRCKESPCVEIVRHCDHVRDHQTCGDPQCQVIDECVSHMELCNRDPCPFCVRIRQRKFLGKKLALDHVIGIQRRKLQQLKKESAAGTEGKQTFVAQQIETFQRKRRSYGEEVDQLNKLVLDKKLPVFNFPRYLWHIDDPWIKKEPESVDNTSAIVHTRSVSPSLPTPDLQATSVPVETKNRADIETTTDELPDQAVSIAQLITKKYSGDDAAVERFDKLLRFAFSVVDAAFCSPAKISRCLLGCAELSNPAFADSLLRHKAHMTQCRDANTADQCEYCLRVTEREEARGVELMEVEQPEVESKIQSLIGAITTSLTHDGYNEREDNVMQLEDELQQAEDYKKDLLDKMLKARLRLRRLRKRMQQLPIPPPHSSVTGLPPHFVKSRPGGSGGGGAHPPPGASPATKRHRGLG